MIKLYTLVLILHVAKCLTNKVITLPLLPHHTVVNRQRSLGENVLPKRYVKKRLLSVFPDHQQVSTLYQGYGTHYVDIWVGSPTAQRQTVIVDTGSQLTAFPCDGCKDCGSSYHTDNYFQTDESETFNKVECGNGCRLGSCQHDECRIGISYQEGSSWSAYEAKDISYVGGMHDEPETQIEGKDYTNGDDIKHASAFSFPLTFGCQTSLTGLFKTQLADGILGLSDERGAFWRQMSDEKVILKNQFSLCFSRQPIVERRGTLAGAITFGGRDDALTKFPMVYTDNIKKNGFYTVRVRNIFLWLENGSGVRNYNDLKNDRIERVDIGEQKLNTDGVIIDSGTTDTYFNKRIQEAFRKAWKKIMDGKEFTNKEVALTEEEFLSMPTIIFQLEGNDDLNKLIGNDPNLVHGLVGDLDSDNPYDILLAMPPNHYFEFDSDINKYVPRFYTDEYGNSVLGANAMMGHDILFDNDNRLIGIAESDCDYLEVLNSPEKKKFTATNKGAIVEENSEVTPFAHPQEDKPFCKDISHCASIAGLILFVSMSIFTLLSKIFRRSYRSTENYIPTMELSSTHGGDDLDVDDDFLNPDSEML